MKFWAILLNIGIPGVGSFLIGKAGQGIAQILIWGLGFLLTVGTLGFGGIIGIPMMLGGWIWAIVTAAGGPDTSVNVQVIHQSSDGQSGS